MKTPKNTLFLRLLILPAFLLIFASCEKAGNGEAPLLPPQSSFVMDLSEFTSTGKDLKLIEPSNRNRAVAIVTVWNTIINLHLAVPVASFAEAFNHEPIRQNDGSWLWTYQVAVGSNTFTAKLYGKRESRHVIWQMRVSKTGVGAFTDFLWFEGKSDLAGTLGEWTLYKSPSENVKFIGIGWYKQPDGTFGITYSNITEGAAENGSYISYIFTLNTPYNAYFDVYNKVQNNLTEIQWHTVNKSGRIKDPLHFGNNNFFCWNSVGVNIVCP